MRRTARLLMFRRHLPYLPADSAVPNYDNMRRPNEDAEDFDDQPTRYPAT